ncbi:low molecular weight phosphotyrosine protein phosphatase [Myceligenerans salitolerans]|uniref:protein-tyrosine-phosphatase n=2 Tax=Myceligenerans salitolerans TaxID=1230528 RepID=A0ABS3IAU4_9MICO|nr:low molecular weight phosphotyrosine protein phosphatase [Myceligenerans salitolerans]
MTVCTGNICRSPMAEIVLRDRFEAAGLDVVVDSTGVSDEERGNPIDHRARAALVARGYPAGEGHVARQATGPDVGSRDLVLAMTGEHARRLRALRPDVDVRLYRSFDPAAATLPSRMLDIADPWYGGPADFEECLDQIEAAADGIVLHVRTGIAA